MSPLLSAATRFSSAKKKSASPTANTTARWTLLRDGVATWADLVDYYARHDCHVDAFVPGYHRMRPAAG